MTGADIEPDHTPKPVEIDGRRLQRSQFATPLGMTVWIVATCYAVMFLISTFGQIPIREEHRVIPLLVGLFLGLCGMGWGMRNVSGARAAIGRHFGVKYLPADHALTRRVHALARRLDLPPPAVGITGVNNAFAMGTGLSDAAVVIGTPLIQSLSPDELDAVIGHELGHVVSGDMRRMLFAEGYQAMFGHMFGAFVVSFVQALARTRSEAALGHSLGAFARSTLFVASEMVVKGLSRAREYRADAVGAALTSPEAMAGALAKLHGMKPDQLAQRYGYLMLRGMSFGGLLSTHPDVHSRVGAITSKTYIRDLPLKFPAGHAAPETPAPDLPGTAEAAQRYSFEPVVTSGEKTPSTPNPVMKRAEPAPIRDRKALVICALAAAVVAGAIGFAVGHGALEGETEDLKAARASVQQERNAVARERSALLTERDTLERARSSLRTEREALESARQALERDLEAVRRERDALGARMPAEAEENTYQSETVAHLQKQIETLRSERDQLGARLAYLSSRNFIAVARDGGGTVYPGAVFVEADAAFKSAMGNCLRETRSNGCAVVSMMENGCVGYAFGTGGDGYGFAGHENRQSAINLARQTCRRYTGTPCTQAVAYCTQ